MLSTPTPHLRSALQSFKLPLKLLKPTPTRAFHLPPPQRRTPVVPIHLNHQHHQRRHASDTSTHPASSHPSASSPAASNPASIPAAKKNEESFSPAPASSTSFPQTSSSSTPTPTPTPTAASTDPLINTTTTSPPSPSPTTTNPTSSPPTALPWNTYLSLRRLRRRYSLLASLLTSTSTTLTGLTVIQSNMDSLSTTLTSIFGLDPIFMLGAATFAAGGAGWLLGPFVGEGVFRLVHRKEWGGMAEKEKSFYARIRRLRVDPSLASYSNPLPDYYGEKIGSVGDFRTWMRDQRAYNRKRMQV